MKPFQQLLLAVAGAGLVAPLAASANELANLNGTAAVNEYMQQQDLDRFRAWESKNQVTSVSQFSDVRPTDWAYQALSNLVEKYGCVAGYPNGTFKGGQAMTRYEAAALLAACLDRVTEKTEELQKLLDEFDNELTVLTARVDGLESKVGKLQAQQFSTTTKLKGEASFIIGGTPNFNTQAVTITPAVKEVKGVTWDGTKIVSCTPGSTGCVGGTAAKSAVTAAPNNTVFNYDVRLSFDTSFNGQDLLRTRIRSGNFSDLPFGSSSQEFKLDKAETGKDQCGTAGAGCAWIDRLYYTFPVGKNNAVKLTAGALVRNTELVSFLPSAYNPTVLDFFALAGSSSVYNKATGAGFGFQWKQQVEKGKPYLTFDANYVSQKGYNNSTVGAFDDQGALNFLTQLGVKGKNWGAAVAYRYGSLNSSLRDPNFVPGTIDNSNGVSLGAYWQPLEAKWFPAITLAGSYTTLDSSAGTGLNVYSWMAGFQWSDVFLKGNTAGFALGMAPYTGDLTSAADSDGLLWEIFYKYQVTDNISITPTIFYSSAYQPNGYDGTWGGVIQATFKF